MGELGLDGRIRPVAGTLAVAEGARRAGLQRVVCAAESAPEAALAGVEPIPVEHLAEAVAYLRGEIDAPPFAPLSDKELESPSVSDLADVRGQERARRALEIAAAGSHNLLLQGPPGTGKTMLARRLPGILPPLGRQESLEVTRIHSVCGLLPPSRPLITIPPFRAPHHGASAPAVVGVELALLDPQVARELGYSLSSVMSFDLPSPTPWANEDAGVLTRGVQLAHAHDDPGAGRSLEEITGLEDPVGEPVLPMAVGIRDGEGARHPSPSCSAWRNGSGSGHSGRGSYRLLHTERSAIGHS